MLAAGINRFDHYLREGSVVPEFPFPHILGADAAGEGVTGFEIGDRVIPMPGFPTNEQEWDVRPAATAASFGLPSLHRPGTYAQYVEILHRPAALPQPTRVRRQSRLLLHHAAEPRDEPGRLAY